jgi:hypothetical protein
MIFTHYDRLTFLEFRNGFMTEGTDVGINDHLSVTAKTVALIAVIFKLDVECMREKTG